MLELHVWGVKGQISVISPESLASSWLIGTHLKAHKVPYNIVTSCNTNMSNSEVLPLLICTETRAKYEGYSRIAEYISEKYPGGESQFLPDTQLDKRQQLINASLISYVENKVKYLNEYNLYINTRNYEKYTRKLFQHYFPFPMMYNQPLKFYHNAQEEVRMVGLTANKVGFFSMSGNLEEVIPETEYFNEANSSDVEDNSEGEDEVAITTLHEKQILANSKKKSLVRELKNSMKCLNSINHYITHILDLYKDLRPESESCFSYLFSESNQLSSSELLLLAYIQCLNHDDLPDKFISNYLQLKFPKFVDFTSTTTKDLNKFLQPSQFRDPQGDETPSLWNEIKYLLGLITY